MSLFGKKRKLEASPVVASTEKIINFNETELTFLNGRDELDVSRRLVSRVVTLSENMGSEWSETRLKSVMGRDVSPTEFNIIVAMTYFDILFLAAVRHLKLEDESMVKELQISSNTTQDVIYFTFVCQYAPKK